MPLLYRICLVVLQLEEGLDIGQLKKLYILNLQIQFFFQYFILCHTDLDLLAIR